MSKELEPNEELVKINKTSSLLMTDDSIATELTIYHYSHEQVICQCGSDKFKVYFRESWIWFVDIECVSCGKIFEVASE